jgi:hypothetical protein
MTRIARGDFDQLTTFLLATSFGKKRRSPLNQNFSRQAHAAVSIGLVAGLLVLRLSLRSQSLALRLSGLANYPAFTEHYVAI